VLAKNLKTKQFYTVLFLGTIPDLDVVVGLFRSCKCSPDSPRHQSSLFLFLFLSPLLGWIISKLENRIDFLQASYMAFGVCLPM
jgi:inner membrane protein